MHFFPPHSELQFLIGKELSEVVLAAQSTHFRWWDEGEISVFGDIEHVDESGNVHAYDSTAYTGRPILLHRLIQKKIIMLEVQPMRLTLGFEGGQLLRLIAEPGRVENGLIQFTNRLEDGWIIY